jgi:hypothetical protein
LALNTFISWYNAKVCGTYWEESKVLGGFPRVLMWCGAIQSAIGFSMLFLLVMLGVAHLTGHLPPELAHATVSLWYLLVILPCIGTGLIITAHSWVIAWRDRSWQNMGAAAWNTFSTGMNIYDLANGGGATALNNIGELFSSDSDDDGRLGRIAIGMVLVAIVGGAMLTAWIIRTYSQQACSEMCAKAAAA